MSVVSDRTNEIHLLGVLLDFLVVGVSVCGSSTGDAIVTALETVLVGVTVGYTSHGGLGLGRPGVSYGDGSLSLGLACLKTKLANTAALYAFVVTLGGNNITLVIDVTRVCANVVGDELIRTSLTVVLGEHGLGVILRGIFYSLGGNCGFPFNCLSKSGLGVLKLVNYYRAGRSGNSIANEAYSTALSDGYGNGLGNNEEVVDGNCLSGLLVCA